MKILERDIEAACTQLLQLDGWRVFHMEQQWSEKKRKSVGEHGMADVLAIRYGPPRRHQQRFARGFETTWFPEDAEVVWLEFKRITGKSGRPTKAAPHQKIWHRDERLRGAMTLIAGEDFPASTDGFIAWYRGSGLMRQRI